MAIDGRDLPQWPIELVDDWHPRGYRMNVGWIGVELPNEIGTQAVEWSYDSEGKEIPHIRVTGRYIRTGTAEDGVPVYTWIPIDSTG